MSKVIQTVIVIVTFFISNSVVVAADLVNSDEVSYTIFVDLDDASKTITIAPKEKISDVCRNCYIEIDGNPDGVSIDNEPLVIIKDGKLFFEEAT